MSIFGCIGMESILTNHFLENAELEFNFIDTKRFDGPKWTKLPGKFIRGQLDEINELYVKEGAQLLKWTQSEQTLKALSKHHVIWTISY